jgi:hypothetical protein
MFFDRLFRSFLPLQNPLGFGGRHFLELGLFLAALTLVSRPWLEPLAAKLAQRTAWRMALAILTAHSTWRCFRIIPRRRRTSR